MIKKLSYCLVMLLFFMSSFTTQAQIKKGYPPYPGVWGYDISEFPAVKWGLAGVTAYAMDDGDIWFIVDYSYKKTKPMNYLAPMTDEKYVLIKFFKGEQTILNTQERETLLKKIEDKEIIGGPNPSDINFSDGSKITIHNGDCPKMCFVPDFYLNYFIKTDVQGNEKKHSILVAHPQVNIQIDEAQCEAQGAPFLYQKLHSLTEVILLKDDTFIVFESGSNLILRFNKNFKTAFKPITPVTIHGNYIMRNFFVIDYALIEKLHSQFISQSVPVYQSIHDALLLQFHALYQK